MFTGIIEQLGEIKAIDRPKRSSLEMLITTQNWGPLVSGESIAVNGICLTVVAPEADCFQCDISPETERLTTVSTFKIEQKVHLERAMRMSDRFGGHFVTGHVDGLCQVIKRQMQGDCLELHFVCGHPDAQRYLIPKGSVALDGVSLTINTIDQNKFSVMFIPYTLEKTHLGQLTIGDVVNIEFDMLVKTIVQVQNR